MPVSSIVSLPSQLVAWLSQQSTMSDLHFLTEFPSTPKATPLRRTIVAVGIENVVIADYYAENGDGVLERSEYCRLATVNIRLGIHVPYSLGGAACHTAFTKIADSLSFNTDLNIITSSCESIQADRDTDAFVMKALIKVEAQFCPAESTGMNYTSFQPKTFFCASHINNPDLHITQAEREKIAVPFETGSYFGSGEANRTIPLDFEPKAVIVGAHGMPPILSENGIQECYLASATAGYGTIGLSLTSSGFRVRSSDTVAVGTHCSRLNKVGLSYFYIAFK